MLTNTSTCVLTHHAGCVTSAFVRASDVRVKGSAMQRTRRGEPSRRLALDEDLRRTVRRAFRASLIASILLMGMPTPAHAVDGVPMGYLLIRTNGRPAGSLLRFSAANPGAADLNAQISITGTGGQRILAIDFRPADGKLYGMSEDSELFRINPATGSATLVGRSTGAMLDPFGGVFQGLGLDFNAVVDRIRLTQDDGVINGQDRNFRVDPNTGSFIQDADLGGTSDVDISGVAYTNSYVGATQSTLYGIETDVPVSGGNARVVVIDPPNAGVLTAIDGNANGLGQGFAHDQEMGFDIVTNRNLAYATLNIGADSHYRLFRIHLGVAAGGDGTGDAELIGTLGSAAAQDAIPGFTVRGMALLPPTYARTLTIGYLSGAFRGQLVSHLPACFRSERVNLYRVRPGPDAKIGSDLTNKVGRYVIQKARIAGTYYAIAPRSTGPFGVCLAKRSSNKTLAPA